MTHELRKENVTPNPTIEQRASRCAVEIELAAVGNQVGPFGTEVIKSALRSATQDNISSVKSWIDYRVHDLREKCGPVDERGCVINPDIDKAICAATINTLVDLRLRLDGQTVPVEGYPEAKHVWIHDADLQRLRATQDKDAEIERLKEKLSTIESCACAVRNSSDALTAIQLIKGTIYEND